MNAPTFQEIKSAIEGMNSAFDVYKQTNEQRLEAVKSGNEALAKELDGKLKKIDADIQKFSDLKTLLETEQKLIRERIEELESRASTPGKTTLEVTQDEQKEAFIGWIRSKGASMEHEQKMRQCEKKLIDMKDITVGTPSAGGYALPKTIVQAIMDLEIKLSPVRRLIPAVQVGTTDFHELIGLRGASSGWVGETGTRTATNTPTLRDILPTFGELYAYPQVSEWSLDDLGFNVENWLTKNIADEFSYQEGLAVISGNGTNKPTGMLNTPPTAVADWPISRAAAVYQYVNNTTSPTALDPDKLIDLVYALNSAYRSGSSYVMNSLTTGGVRKLKDQNNQYLWQPSVQAGQPNMLNGYPVETWEDLDDVAQNKFPVAFGNFPKGYLLVDRIGMRITRDNVTTPGYVKFYVRRREGGIVLDNNAIKWIRTI
jgi:HK97 family phage major capsid protein